LKDVPLLPKVQRVRVDEWLADRRNHHEATDCRGLREAGTRLTPLLAYFTGRRANAISGDVLTSYVQHRQVAGLANGTINRELSVLGKAFKLGLEHGKVLRRPVIHLLKEARPRHRGTGIL
jgi:site-specific recombinase XerD